MELVSPLYLHYKTPQHLHYKMWLLVQNVNNTAVVLWYYTVVNLQNVVTAEYSVSQVS